MTPTRNNYRALNNLFDEFFTAVPTWGREFNWSVPPVNIHESKDNYELELVAPGLKKEDFKVNIEKGLLTISYEKQTSAETTDQKTHRKEFNITNFKRSFNVDEKINADGIQARYENGVLKLTLPKKEEVKASPKEIAIL
jgi:HSP20 family protein